MGKRIYKEWGNPHNRTLRGHRITLKLGQQYDIGNYCRAQGKAQEWVETHTKRMMKYVQEGMAKEEGHVAKKKRPVMQILSYLLQEAEAASRGAKIAWCESNAVTGFTGNQQPSEGPVSCPSQGPWTVGGQ